MNYELFYPGIHKIILKIQNLNHLTLYYIIIQGVLYGQVGIFHFKTINEHLYHKKSSLRHQSLRRVTGELNGGYWVNLG